MHEDPTAPGAHAGLTGVLAYAVYESASDSSGPCDPGDFYCDVGAAALQGLEAAITTGLVVFVWPIELGLIWAVALIGKALVDWIRASPERRRYWAELKMRDEASKPRLSARGVGDEGHIE